MSTKHTSVECPYCGDEATIELYTHYPGGRRLGQEQIITLKEKGCDCEWKHSDAESAFMNKLGIDE